MIGGINLPKTAGRITWLKAIIRAFDVTARDAAHIYRRYVQGAK